MLAKLGHALLRLIFALLARYMIFNYLLAPELGIYPGSSITHNLAVVAEVIAIIAIFVYTVAGKDIVGKGD